MADAIGRFVTDHGMVEVVTFGADHPRRLSERGPRLL
jgi:hypothetical protein